MQLFVESLVFTMLMISLMLKANVVSVIFLLFIIRFAFTQSKSEVLQRATIYLCFLFVLMYFLYLINLTSKSQVQSFPSFPRGLKNYPVIGNDVSKVGKRMSDGYVWTKVGFVPPNDQEAFDDSKDGYIKDWTSGAKY